MSWTGRHILRGRALCLLVLTPTLTILSYLGVLTGMGPYGGLAETPLAVSGLVQAYPLMGLIGAVMWAASRGPAPHRGSLLAIAAHCIPLSALAVLWGPINPVQLRDPRGRDRRRDPLSPARLRRGTDMRRGIVYDVAVSIDGYIAGPGGDLSVRRETLDSSFAIGNRTVVRFLR